MKCISQRTINKNIRRCFENSKDLVYPSILINSLNQSFNRYKINFDWLFDDKVELNSFETSGYFIPEHCVLIVLAFNENSSIPMILDEEGVFDISTTIQHEFIHVDQYSKHPESFENNELISTYTETDVEQLRRYFSTSDEVDAYSLNILLEMSFQKEDMDRTDIVDMLNKSVTWKIYQYFPENNEKLLKNIYELYDSGVRWQ